MADPRNTPRQENNSNPRPMPGQGRSSTGHSAGPQHQYYGTAGGPYPRPPGHPGYFQYNFYYMGPGSRPTTGNMWGAGPSASHFGPYVYVPVHPMGGSGGPQFQRSTQNPGSAQAPRTANWVPFVPQQPQGRPMGQPGGQQYHAPAQSMGPPQWIRIPVPGQPQGRPMPQPAGQHNRPAQNPGSSRSIRPGDTPSSPLVVGDEANRASRQSCSDLNDASPSTPSSLPGYTPAIQASTPRQNPVQNTFVPSSSTPGDLSRQRRRWTRTITPARSSTPNGQQDIRVRKLFSGFPDDDEPLPEGLSLAEIVRDYPNHIDEDVLRKLIYDPKPWSARMIYEGLAPAAQAQCPRTQPHSRYQKLISRVRMADGTQTEMSKVQSAAKQRRKVASQPTVASGSDDDEEEETFTSHEQTGRPSGSMRLRSMSSRAPQLRARQSEAEQDRTVKEDDEEAEDQGFVLDNYNVPQAVYEEPDESELSSPPDEEPDIPRDSPLFQFPAREVEGWNGVVDTSENNNNNSDSNNAVESENYDLPPNEEASESERDMSASRSFRSSSSTRVASDDSDLEMDGVSEFDVSETTEDDDENDGDYTDSSE
ncbi:MAG: hypothetical protein Q9227_001046 [Pyrenula ochraceoflavens]